MLVGHGHRGVAHEGGPYRQQFVEEAARRVEVRAGVDLLALGLFRREVLGGADHRGRLRHGHAGVAHGAGDAEVHHLDLAVAGQHDVGRLDVTVDDAVAVRVLQALEDADGHLHGALGQQLATGVEEFAERGAVYVLHHDVRDGDPVDVVLARVVDRDDRGMVERGGRLGLPAEPGLEGRVAREVRAQRLHRHGAAEAGVMREVDLRHATAAEHLAQLVPAAEATRLFHSYLPALSVGSRPRTPVRGRRLPSGPTVPGSLCVTWPSP